MLDFTEDISLGCLPWQIHSRLSCHMTHTTDTDACYFMDESALWCLGLSFSRFALPLKIQQGLSSSALCVSDLGIGKEESRWACNPAKGD